MEVTKLQIQETFLNIDHINAIFWIVLVKYCTTSNWITLFYTSLIIMSLQKKKSATSMKSRLYEKITVA